MSPKPPTQNNLRSNLSDAYRSLEPYLSLGLTSALTLLIFLFLGYWLDSKWGSSPWLTVSGGFIGMFLGFLYMFYTLRSLTSSDPDKPKHEE